MLFIDVDYVKNATYLNYLNYLVHDKNWELGVHFTNSLSNQSTAEAVLEMNTEFQQIRSDFNGTDPVTWCSLGNHDNATHSIYAWDALDLLNRNQLVAYQPSCSYSLCNGSWDLWISQAKAGIACPPLYTHETDLDNAISSSIDWTKFDQWVQVLNGSGIRIVGYREWYSIEENQVEANEEILHQNSTDIEFTMHTNGQPSDVSVMAPSVGVISVTDLSSGLNVSFKVVEGRAIFETLDNHTYVVNGPQAVRNANNADPSMLEFEGIVIALAAVGLVVFTMVKRKRRQ
jgi:hypothetical protein